MQNGLSELFKLIVSCALLVYTPSPGKLRTNFFEPFLFTYAGVRSVFIVPSGHF